MKKLAILFLILGIVLLCVGVGARLIFDTNPDIQEASEMLEMFIGQPFSPDLAARLIGGKLTVMGMPITMEDLLGSSPDAQNAVALLTLYAYSTYLMVGGAVLLLLGLIIPKGSAKKAPSKRTDSSSLNAPISY